MADLKVSGGSGSGGGFFQDLLKGLDDMFTRPKVKGSDATSGKTTTTTGKDEGKKKDEPQNDLGILPSLTDIYNAIIGKTKVDDVVDKIKTESHKVVMDDIKTAAKDEFKDLLYVKDATAPSGKKLGAFGEWFSTTTVGKWFGFGDKAETAVTAGTEVAKAAGTGVAKAAGAEGAAAGSTTASLGANIFAAATGLYDMVKNFGKMTLQHGVVTGATTGAAIGTMTGIPGGTLIGAGIGAIVGGIASLFKNSGKSKDQKERDQFRKILQQGNVIDDKFTIGLADGSRYDVGIDGKAKKEFGGRKPYELDPANPLSTPIATLFAPVMATLAKDNQNIGVSFTGYFTNAAVSNANGDMKVALVNAAKIYTSLGANIEDFAKNVVLLAQKGAIKAEDAKAFVQALSGASQSQPSQPTTAPVTSAKRRPGVVESTFVKKAA